MSKQRAILAYSVLGATGVLLAWLAGELEGKFNVFVRRSILGLLLVVGASSGIALLIPQFIHRADTETLTVISKSGKATYVRRGTAKGFFFGLIVSVLLLVRDYFRHDSITDNLGLYASLVLVSSFAFFSTATRTWKVNERNRKFIVLHLPF